MATSAKLREWSSLYINLGSEYDQMPYQFTKLESSQRVFLARELYVPFVQRLSKGHVMSLLGYQSDAVGRCHGLHIDSVGENHYIHWAILERSFRKLAVWLVYREGPHGRRGIKDLLSYSSSGGAPEVATTLLHFPKCLRPFIQIVKSTFSDLKCCTTPSGAPSQALLDAYPWE